MEVLKVDEGIVIDDLTDAVDVDGIELGHNARRNEAVLDSQLGLLGGGEDELVQVVEDVLKGLGAGFVDLDDLGDDGSVEGLIFDLGEEREQFLNFLLHV